MDCVIIGAYTEKTEHDKTYHFVFVSDPQTYENRKTFGMQVRQLKATKEAMSKITSHFLPVMVDITYEVKPEFKIPMIVAVHNPRTRE